MIVIKIICVTAIISSLVTLLILSIIRDVKRCKQIPEHIYKIGDRVIYKQCNCKVNRLVGCEIIELRRYTKSKKTCYKVKVYTEDIDIWVIAEEDIQCTEEQLGFFPTYNINKQDLFRRMINKK